MKTKILLWGAVLIQIAGNVAGAFRWLGRPQFVILSNGNNPSPQAVPVVFHKGHFHEFTVKPQKAAGDQS
jgi:hypothetical protein